MTSPTRDLAALVERLEKVECHLRVAKRRNHWLLVAVGLAVMGLVLVWTLANTTATAQAQGAKVIRANQFIVEDENGRVRARLAMVKDALALTLFDENGKARAFVAAAKTGPSLVLVDENGKPRASLTVLKDGSPGLSLADETGKRIWSQP